MAYFSPHNDRQAIGFLLDFAQMDLGTLREGAFLDLCTDVLTFLGGWPRPQDLSLARLKELQKVAWYVFNQVALSVRQLNRGGIVTVEDFNLQPRERPGGIQVYVESDPESRKPIGVNFHIFVQKAGFTFALQPVDFRLRLVAGKLRDAFLFAVGFTLSRLRITCLRICPMQECNRIFFAEHGRQQFCSHIRANRAATRRFRAKHREQERKRAQANYKRRVNEKVPGARITRRSKI